MYDDVCKYYYKTFISLGTIKHSFIIMQQFRHYENVINVKMDLKLQAKIIKTHIMFTHRLGTNNTMEQINNY